MSGTKEGGIKTAQKNKAKNPNYYAVIGAEGGKAKNPRKGFGYDDRKWWEKLLRRPKRAQLAGKRGGTISKRRSV